MERRSESLSVISRRFRSEGIYAPDAICLMSRGSRPESGHAGSAGSSSQAGHGPRRRKGENEMYKCISCKKGIDKLEGKVRCPYCGFRIYAKVRPDTVRRVVAR